MSFQILFEFSIQHLPHLDLSPKITLNLLVVAYEYVFGVLVEGEETDFLVDARADPVDYFLDAAGDN